MSKILVIAEHDNNEINSSTNKCISCAKQIQGSEIDLVVFTDGNNDVVEQATKIDSVNSVIAVKAEYNVNQLATVLAPQIKAISDSYTHIFGPSTTFGKDLMPRIAALLDVNQISDVMEIVDTHTFKRPIYAGNAIITVESKSTSKVIATVRTASFKAAESNNIAPIKEMNIDVEIPNHTRFVSIQSGKTDRPDLQTAKKVVSGGRALASEENFEIIYSLADTMQAGAGASRAAVDAGYVPNEMQVGQTGKIIAPDLYIAIGISGAIQHLTGIKDAGTIVAINKDEDAPIVEVADIGLIGDLFNVVPEFESAIKDLN